MQIIENNRNYAKRLIISFAKFEKFVNRGNHGNTQPETMIAMIAIVDSVPDLDQLIRSSTFSNETMKKKLPSNCLAPYWIVGDEVSALEASE